MEKVTESSSVEEWKVAETIEDHESSPLLFTTCPLTFSSFSDFRHSFVIVDVQSDSSLHLHREEGGKTGLTIDTKGTGVTGKR